MIHLTALAALALQPAPTVIPDEAPLVCKKIIVQGETGTFIKRDSGEQLCLAKDEWRRVERSRTRLARAVDNR